MRGRSPRSNDDDAEDRGRCRGSRGAELGDERSSEGLGEGSGEEKDSGEDKCELGLQIDGTWVSEQRGGNHPWRRAGRHFSLSSRSM